MNPLNLSTTWEAEKQILQGFVQLPGKYVIEIGAYQGSTSLALVKTCRKFNKQLIVIDPWEEVGGPEARKTFLEQTKDYSDIITVIRDLSVYALPYLPSDVNENVCLVFIDGDHNYPAPLADLHVCYPLLSVGGVAVVHDLFDHDHASGIQRSIDQFVDTLPKPTAIHYFRHKPNREELVEHGHPDNSHEHGGLGWVFKTLPKTS